MIFKKKLSVIVAVVTVIATLLTFGLTASAAASEKISSEEKLAQESGQAWLDRTAPHVPDLPEWIGAQVVSPQIYYGLDGDVLAFQFSMVNKDKVVGNVLVGASPYTFHTLRASEVKPPAIPTSEEVKKTLEELGVKVDLSEVKEPVRLVYTGVDGQYALYEIADKTIAVNLFTKEAVLASKLEPTTVPKERSAVSQSIGSDYGTKSTGYYYLTMTAYQYGYCGPASGVSIGRYYRDVVGYSSLYSNSVLYSWLYYDMNCANWNGGQHCLLIMVLDLKLLPSGASITTSTIPMTGGLRWMTTGRSLMI